MNWNKLTNGKGAVFELTDGYWTNGHVAIKGGVPIRLRNLKSVEVVKSGTALASLIPPHHAHEAATVEESDDGQVLLVADTVSVYIDPFFHKVLCKYIGSFTYMLHDHTTVILCVNSAGVAGSVMPIYYPH